MWIYMGKHVVFHDFILYKISHSLWNFISSRVITITIYHCCYSHYHYCCQCCYYSSPPPLDPQPPQLLLSPLPPLTRKSKEWGLRVRHKVLSLNFVSHPHAAFIWFIVNPYLLSYMELKASRNSSSSSSLVSLFLHSFFFCIFLVSFCLLIWCRRCRVLWIMVVFLLNVLKVGIAPPFACHSKIREYNSCRWQVMYKAISTFSCQYIYGTEQEFLYKENQYKKIMTY